MSTSKTKILDKLRESRRPFAGAAPRPAAYKPVTSIDDTSVDGLIARFREELELLKGELFIVKGETEARDAVIELLSSHDTKRIASWQFKHIPVKKLYTAIKDAGITVDYPNIHGEDRIAEIQRLETAEVGLTGVDAAAATTGTLIVSTAKGKSRIPTVLPPVHIAVMKADQLLPRIEDWLASMRGMDNGVLEESANICFITGPSRTADIEKQLVLGAHGPKRLQVVLIR